MATMRTPEERMRIAKHCVKLEQEGGDILAYLYSENYMTPRATWYNIQREFLGRKRYEYTDGKPCEGGAKKVILKLTDERKKQAIQIAVDGGDPRVFLARECGMKDPVGAWWKLRAELKDTDPDTFDRLPPRLPKNGAWKNHTDIFQKPLPKKAKADKGMPKQEEPDTVLGKPKEEFENMKELKLEGGQDYQLKVAEVPEEKKPEELFRPPMKWMEFTVTAVRHDVLGEFYYDKKYETIDWRTPEGDEVSFGPGSWKQLYEKLPEIMGILGVRV